MKTKQNHKQSIVPLLSISSIKNSKNWTLVQTERYDKQSTSLYLVKSHTSTLPVKQKINKPARKNSQSNACSVKINKTFDFIASNIIPCQVQTRSKRNFSLMLQKMPQNKQKSELGPETLRKISQQRQKKVKLLTQLITNYKLQKSKSKINVQQQNCYFATEICQIEYQRNNLSCLQQTKCQAKTTKIKREQPKNSFPFDPDLKTIVQHEIAKLWKLKSKTNAKVNQFNLVNYYQRSNYQKKLKNIKITQKK